MRELSLKYTSVDRLVDKQNQALCAVLKCQGGAGLNAELVENLIEKIYVYPGKRIEVLWEMEGYMDRIESVRYFLPEGHGKEKNFKNL